MSANVERVSAAASSQRLIGFRSERRHLTVYNDSQTSTLFVRIGAAPTTTIFTEAILPGGTWRKVTRDEIYGLWDGADGAAVVTEEF